MAKMDGKLALLFVGTNLGDDQMTESRISHPTLARFLVVAALLLAGNFGLAQQVDSQQPKTVSIEVAKLVAAEYLPKYYPAEWQYLNHYVCYSLDGAPAAYAIVFRKLECQLQGAEDVDQHIAQVAEARRDLRKQLQQTAEKAEQYSDLKRQCDELRRSLYLFDELATVITGATTTSGLILRCYRGLPPLVAEGYELRTEMLAQKLGVSFELDRILFFSPTDLRYEVRSAGKAGVAQEQPQPVDDHSYSLSLKDSALNEIRAEKDRLERREQRRTQELSELNEAERNDIQRATSQRNKANADKWEEYSRRLSK
jgi:hypothetical protein